MFSFSTVCKVYSFTKKCEGASKSGHFDSVLSTADAHLDKTCNKSFCTSVIRFPSQQAQTNENQMTTNTL